MITHDSFLYYWYVMEFVVFSLVTILPPVVLQTPTAHEKPVVP
jgi:hypothetical protein